MSESGHVVEVHSQLRTGRLSVADTVGQSLGFVAPVMGVAYLTPLVAAYAGAATPLAMLLGGIGVLAIGLAVAQFARRYPHAGSIYEYVSREFGPFPGFMAGWTYFIGAFFLTAGIFPGIGGFIQGTFASHDITVPWLPFSLAFIVISFLLQYFDVRFATRIQLVIILVASAVILVFALYVIARGGSEGLSIKPFLPSSSAAGLSGLGKGLVFAFLMFTGFEASAVLSEETKDARRVIAITVLASVGIIIAYFLITVYSEALSYGSAAASEWGSDPTPLFTMGAKFGNSALVDVLSVAAIIDAIAVTVACSVTATRMLYALGRDGILPSVLGRTHKTHKTPHVAIYAVLGGSLVYTLITYFSTDAITGFGFGGGTGSLALILIYLVLSFAAFRLEWGGVTVLRFVVPAVGVVLTAYAFYASVYPAPPAPAKFMPYLMLATVIVGAVIGLAARARRVPAILDVEAQVQPDVA